MQLVGRDIEMDEVRQVSNVGWQANELVVSQVQLRQVTKVPQRRAQVCDTTCTTIGSRLTGHKHHTVHTQLSVFYSNAHAHHNETTQKLNQNNNYHT